MEVPLLSRRMSAAAAICIALLAATACGSDGGGVSTVGLSATPAITPIDIADVSLPPASTTAEPETIPTSVTVPSVDLPSGDPSPFLPPSDYRLGADDLAAFGAAYDAVFGVSGLDDAGYDAVGSHLCTYLMRHADVNGVVDLESALIEADINEPGYTRGDWLAAFEIADAYYCGEFAVPFASTGG